MARYCTSFPDDNYVFQDDNVPVHRARVVKEYIEDTDLHGMKWPAHSPNIIENVWHKIKKELQKQVQNITSVVGNWYSQHMDRNAHWLYSGPLWINFQASEISNYLVYWLLPDCYYMSFRQSSYVYYKHCTITNTMLIFD